jgi:hypothetical protein
MRAKPAARRQDLDLTHSVMVSSHLCQVTRRMRSRSKPTRPYIWPFEHFVLVTLPSTAGEL